MNRCARCGKQMFFSGESALCKDCMQILKAEKKNSRPDPAGRPFSGYETVKQPVPIPSASPAPAVSLVKKPCMSDGKTHFSYGNANPEQIEAIRTVDGPVLITAGPGTGKTFTLVQRAAYLIQEKGVQPEEIMMVTFTEKAARELVTRITNALAGRNIQVDINQMYIGTFHSICLRMIKEHPEHARVSKGFRVLDGFDQPYVIYRNINAFRKIPGFLEKFQNDPVWTQCGAISQIVNNLSEEMVDLDAMRDHPNPDMPLIAEICRPYRKILDEEKLMDFSSLQVDAYNMLREDPEALREMRAKIRYIMVDEYQDTNYIQEQIVFLLAGDTQNICVVGDDDQGLYRFRGATIRNILEFPDKFPKGKCSIIQLVTNYRSNSDIVDFYNAWMASPQIRWGRFRYDKKILPFRKSAISSPAVAKLSQACPYKENEPYFARVLRFLRTLKQSGRIQDYNQTAFLFYSVKNKQVRELADYLEAHGIQVYSPRANMFFKRPEIRMSIGMLLILFTGPIKEVPQNKILPDDTKNYYRSCINEARQYLASPQGAPLSEWIRLRSDEIRDLTGKASYGLKNLLYQMYAFEPFQSYLAPDVDAGAVQTRPARNLSLFMQMTGKFEYQHYMEKLSGENLVRDTESLFWHFLRLLVDQGIDEYEDMAEYAPSGCVSFLTIHQAKGLEFPIVFVGSLLDYNLPDSGCREFAKGALKYTAGKYYRRSPFEPEDQTSQFDLWRLYYTAFSRAQDLLILTCPERTSKNGRYSPSPCFAPFFDPLPQADSPMLRLSEFDFSPVKAVNLKEAFSYTTHIAVYDTCPRKYKLTQELAFEPEKTVGMFFGQLVHTTIEDVHRQVLDHNCTYIPGEMVEDWFHANYAALVKAHHMYLGKEQQEAALHQVLRYVRHQQHMWDRVRGAEYDLSIPSPGYIINGTIDLIVSS